MQDLSMLAYPLPLALFAIILSILLQLRGSRAGSVLFIVALLGLWLLATEPVSQALRAQLEHQHPGVAADSVPAAAAIVVLGGGARPNRPPRISAELGHMGDRLRMAHALYAEERAPLIITTGAGTAIRPGVQSEAEAAAELLTGWGVPGDALIVRGDSRSTVEDAATVRRAVREHDLGRILLVTSALHMPRALQEFRALGLDVLPVPANFEGLPERVGRWSDFVPSAESLWLSTRVWHEYLGMLHYRARGWLG